MTSTATLRVLVCASACAWTAGVAATPQQGPAMSPTLAASCYGCHAPPGAGSSASTNDFRRLDDLSADEIAVRLKLYKRGTLSGTLMNRIARGYSDSELDTLAAHFGRTTP